MASILQWAQNIWRGPPSAPRSFVDSQAQILDNGDLLEEETLPGYSPRYFYPLKIGDVLVNKYQVLSKLGFGATSTVWLSRDLIAHRYVVLKVYIQEGKQAGSTNREIEIYERLAGIQSNHPGQKTVRKPIGSFLIDGPDGQHHCIVHEPLAMSLQEFRQMFPSRSLPDFLVKASVKEVLKALDFLHRLATITHTDIKPPNLLMTVKDSSILQRCEKAELEEPSPRKHAGDRIIYQSRQLSKPKKWGDLVLIDFGEACFGKQHFRNVVQPELYRAPEVILHMDWDYKVDIWNLGVMTWDLLEGEYLFDATGPNDGYSDEVHLSEIIGRLGLPDPEFVKRIQRYPELFTEDGTWQANNGKTVPPLKESERVLEGTDRELFLDFIRCMLQWDPATRSTAEELLKHAWLVS